MANSTDRARARTRSRRRARRSCERELAPMRRERFQRERDITEALGLADGLQRDVRAAERRLARRRCATSAQQFLRDTQAMWDEVLPGVREARARHRRRARRRAPTRSRCSARASSTSTSPPATMEPSIRRQVREMGIDPLADGRITLRHGRARREAVARVLRAGARAGRGVSRAASARRPDRLEHVPARARARAALRVHASRPPVRVPLAGRQLGHRRLRDAVRPPDAGRGLAAALHGARTSSASPAFLRAAGFEELHFLRRYCAKLIYEIELYGGDVSWDALPDLYVELLTTATTFRYDRADAFVDVDPRYYAARYLRAWQLQALIDRDARRAVRRGLVAQSARGPVDLRGAVRRRRSASWRTSRRERVAGKGRCPSRRWFGPSSGCSAEDGRGRRANRVDSPHGQTCRSRDRRIPGHRTRYRASACAAV